MTIRLGWEKRGERCGIERGGRRDVMWVGKARCMPRLRDESKASSLVNFDSLLGVSLSLYIGPRG